MAITTTASLLELIEKSKLLAAEQLAKAGEMAAGTDDPRELARALVQEKVLTRWQAGQLLAGRSSFFLGKYKLIDLLGRGGMGSVFLAQHTTMNRPVALKIVSKQFGRDPEVLERFLIEARAIAALDHPNIVHAYSVDSEGDRYFLAMEHVEGQNLQQMVEAEGPPACRRAADYIGQAALGLAHAHRQNMIHCDVKPANLLVNRQGVVKILDLGMARLAGRDADSSAGQDQRVLGTVDYLAPEQALEGEQLDHRADVYSLGCTLYFLLTGHPPFPEGTLPERILKHQTQEPRPIAEDRPDVPGDLVEICRRMMAKDPADRFQTADEVAEALAQWQPAGESGAKTPAQPPGLPLVVDPAASGAVRVRARPKGPGQWARLVEAGRGLYRERPRLVLFSALGATAGAALIVGLIVLWVTSGDEPAGSVAANVAPAVPAADVADEPSAESSDRAAADSDPWPEVASPDLQFDPMALGENLDSAAERGTSDSAKERNDSAPGAGEAAEADSPPAEPDPKKPARDEPPQEEPAEMEPAAKAGDSDPSQQAGNGKQATEEERSEGPPADAAPQEEPSQEPDKGGESSEPDGGEPPDAEGGQSAPPKKPQPGSAAKKGPFDGFPDTVDLPELAGQPTPVELGTVHSSPDTSWQLLLLGGDRALKSTRQMDRKFVVGRGQSDSAQTVWAVELAETGADDATSTSSVAEFRRAGQALSFQWGSEADAASANYFRNCVLQMRVAGESHYVSFLRAVEVEPMTIDLVRGLATVNADVKWLPESSNLLAAITKVEGREGHRVDPAEPAEPGPPVDLFFDRTDRHGNTRDSVKFRVLFTPRSTGLSVKLQLVEPPSMQFRALDPQNLTVVKNMIGTKQNEVLKQLNPKDKDKAPRGTLRSALNRQLDELEKMLWYIEFFEQVHEQAKVHFSLWTEVDGRKLVLVETGPSQAE